VAQGQEIIAGEKVKKKDVKIRGVYEKLPGSGVWWIQYFRWPRSASSREGRYEERGDKSLPEAEDGSAWRKEVAAESTFGC
jgi:hypothetical protein